MPIEQDIGNAYANYFTHDGAGIPSTGSSIAIRILRSIRSAYAAAEFNLDDGRPPLIRKLLASPMHILPIRWTGVDLPMRFLSEGKAGRALDVGCGRGEFLQLAARLGWDAEGIEIDPAAAAVARGRGLTVHQSDLKAQNLPAKSFDLIHLSHVIEHLHDPIALLAECRRVLRSGARLIAFTPNADSWGHRLFREDWRGLEPPRHLHLFNPKTLRTTATEAGFGMADVSRTLRGTHYLLTGSMAIRRARLGESTSPRTHHSRVAEQLPLGRKPLLGGELLLDARND